MKTTFDLKVSEMTFYQKLKSAFEHVLMYEDLQLQEKARSCVPHKKLQQMATEKFNSAKVTYFRSLRNQICLSNESECAIYVLSSTIIHVDVVMQKNAPTFKVLPISQFYVQLS